jgi:hypothetical protein
MERYRGVDPSSVDVEHFLADVCRFIAVGQEAVTLGQIEKPLMMELDRNPAPPDRRSLSGPTVVTLSSKRRPKSATD